MLQLFLKTMKFVSLDESGSLRTKISGCDPQTYPGTFQFFLAIRELLFENYCGKSIANLEARNEAHKQQTQQNNKSDQPHRTRLDRHIFIDNENLHISVSARSFMATKITSVCDGRLHFTITATCPSDCCM